MQHFLLSAARGLGWFLVRAAVITAKVMLWLVPLAAALAALMGLAAWVLGIPGSSTRDYYAPWLLGFVVLGGYLGAYGAYLVMVVTSISLKRPKLYYSATALIWVCMIAASAVMPAIWSTIFGE